MATAPSTQLEAIAVNRKLGIVRLAIATALTAGAVFILCWLGTLVPFSSPTHAYIALFTNAESNSVAALVEGTCWSVLFGLLVGALFALLFNATAGLERR